MRVTLGLATVRKVQGIVDNDLDQFDGEKWTTKEVPRSDFYTVRIPVHVSHETMDERDAPLDYDMSVRIPILADDEPFPKIVARAKEQLRQDALEISEALKGER
jgi:hypothetical protein